MRTCDSCVCEWISKLAKTPGEQMWDRRPTGTHWIRCPGVPRNKICIDKQVWPQWWPHRHGVRKFQRVQLMREKVLPGLGNEQLALASYIIRPTMNPLVVVSRLASALKQKFLIL